MWCIGKVAERMHRLNYTLYHYLIFMIAKGLMIRNTTSDHPSYNNIEWDGHFTDLFSGRGSDRLVLARRFLDRRVLNFASYHVETYILYPLSSTLLSSILMSSSLLSSTLLSSILNFSTLMCFDFPHQAHHSYVKVNSRVYHVRKWSAPHLCQLDRPWFVSFHKSCSLLRHEDSSY